MFRRRDRRDIDGTADEAGQDAVAGAPEELDEGDLEEGGPEPGDPEQDQIDEELEDEPEDMTADLESQAADYLAGNDVWMYGPNAEAVLEILDRLEEITPAEARPIAESWLAIPKADRELARKAVRKIYESDEEQNRHLQLAREAVGTWMAVTAGYPEYVNAEPDWARICAQTGEAALDATTALILEETLEEAHFEALFTPWSETTAQLDEEAEAAAAAEAGTIVTGEDEVTEDDEFEEGGEEAAFGPNSDAVADFLNRLWLITPEQVGRLVGGWQNAPRQELHQAHEALQSLVDEDPEYRYQVRAAQEKLAPWLNSGRIQETSSFLGQSGQGESRKMAGPALADAIAALVLGDLLEPVDAEVLYGPWFNLIGAPPLPEIGEEEAPKPKGKASTSAKAKIEPKSPAKPEATAKSKPVGKAKPAAAPKGGAKSKPAAKSTPAAKAKAKGKPKK